MKAKRKDCSACDGTGIIQRADQELGECTFCETTPFGTSGFSYLASPYTHKDPFVREQRYLYALKVTADRLKRQEWTYSPIVHCHEMAKLFGMPVEHEFWLDYDRTMIRAAEKMLILRIEGWDRSTGLLSEQRYAEEIGKPVEYI